MYFIILISILCIVIFIKVYITYKHPELLDIKWTLTDLKKIDTKTYRLVQVLLYYALFASFTYIVHLLITSLINLSQR
jgi:hypothetical protein